MHKRNAGQESRHLGNGRKIVGFLNGIGGQHRKSRLTAGHDIGMVTENGQRVPGNCPCRHMHDKRC